MASSTKMLETEMKIQQAFMTLMHQEGFSKLSVQQLAKLAGISRGTFYLHYFDKYDLLAHYEDEMIGHVKSILPIFPNRFKLNTQQTRYPGAMLSFSCSSICIANGIWPFYC